jgi:hypothetical protein
VFQNILGISSLAEELLASPEGLCSTELFTLFTVVQQLLVMQSAEKETAAGSI